MVLESPALEAAMNFSVNEIISCFRFCRPHPNPVILSLIFGLLIEPVSEFFLKMFVGFFLVNLPTAIAARIPAWKYKQISFQSLKNLKFNQN